MLAEEQGTSSGGSECAGDYGIGGNLLIVIIVEG